MKTLELNQMEMLEGEEHLQADKSIVMHQQQY